MRFVKWIWEWPRYVGEFFFPDPERTRREWAEYQARWEADTEPGYPMSKWDQERRALALAWADFTETLFGAIGNSRPMRWLLRR